MFKKIKLRTRLLFFGIGLTALPLLFALGLVIFQNNQSTATARDESIKLADADFKHLIQGVYTLATTQQELIEKGIASSLNVAEDQAKQRGGLNMTAWRRSIGRPPISFPARRRRYLCRKCSIGTEWLGQIENKELVVPVVDEVRDLVQTTCTIFQKMNAAGDMLRVATNVLNTDGTRAIGTYIPSTNPDGTANPVIQAVMKGETFVGRAYVVNAWYITAYKPILDARQADRRHDLCRCAAGKYGLSAQGNYGYGGGQDRYVEVFDSKGTYVISKGGSEDGKVVMNLKDSAGQPYMRGDCQRGGERLLRVR